MDIILDQSSKSLLCCRVCLLTDCRLYDIHEYKLADALSRISGMPIYKGRLPQYLCTYCHTLLLKCADFRLMCLRTDRCLKQELLKGELTTNRILQIDRTANKLCYLTSTEVEHVNLPAENMVNEPNYVVNTIKVENVEDDDIASINEYDPLDFEANINRFGIDKTIRDDFDIINLDKNTDESCVNLDVAKVAKNIDIDKQNVVGTPQIHINTGNGIISLDKDNDESSSINLYVGKIANNIDVVKQNVVGTPQTHINTGNSITSLDKDKDQSSSVNLFVGKIAKKNIDVVKQNVVRTPQTHINTGNGITSLDESSSVNLYVDKIAKDINVVKQNVVATPQTHLNTGNATSNIQKPELKMELAIMGGELKIKVVKDIENNLEMRKTTFQNVVKSSSLRGVPKTKKNVCKTDVNKVTLKTVPKFKRKNVVYNYSIITVPQMKTGNENNFNTEIINEENDEVYQEDEKETSNKDQFQIFNNNKRKVSENVVKSCSIITVPQMDTGNENDINTDIINEGTDEVYQEEEKETPNKSQIHIFKNIEDIYNNPGMLNATLLKKLSIDTSYDQFRRPEGKRLEFDFAKFEKNYAVKIVVLTKEEQLEEIAQRKESTKYKEARFPCEDCGRGYDMEAAYNNHRLRHSPSAGDVECDICRARFNAQCRLRDHMEFHRLKYCCQYCDFVSRRRTTAKAHYEMHEGRTWHCTHCGKVFFKPTTCYSHIRLAHPAEHDVCDLCGETFIGPKGVYTHKLKMHKHKETPIATHYKCETCSASFIDEDALKTHMDLGEHTGSACEQCGESCTSEEALRAHVEERHPAESLRCEECDASFSSRHAFDNHYRRKHLNQRYVGPYRAWRKRTQKVMCDQCGKTYQTKALLQRHVMIKHLGMKLETPLNFPCPECPKSFSTIFVRREHMKRHTGERPFHCDQCPRTFTSKTNWQRHYKVVHLGQREHHPCPHCPSSTTTRASLRVHIDAVHNKKGWPKRVRRRKTSTTSS